MRPYLETARRYLLVILVVLALTWGAGAAVGYSEYATSFEADATIWTDRQSAQFAPLGAQDPGLSSFVTPAQQQAGLLSQLLVTRSFLQQVLERASIPQPEDADERDFYQGISKRYRVDVLGTNLVRLSYRASDPHSGSLMVQAALAVRQERLNDTRTAATAAAATFYGSELNVAQNRVVNAQRVLAGFDQTHPGLLSPADTYSQNELRLALQDARARVADLQARIDSSGVLPAILGIADALDFQVIDSPLGDVKPSGGLRPAAVIVGSAGSAGLALVALIVILGTLLAKGSARKSQAGARQPSESERRSLDLPASTSDAEPLNAQRATSTITLGSGEPPRVAARSIPPTG